jgi:4-hydroxy-4-methyl-2-oxoglutarate aldolase
MTTTDANDALAQVDAVGDAALLHEAMGKRGALAHDIRPIYPGARCIGRALTIRGRPGDNLMLHLAISVAKPGDVLVATVDGFLEAGGWGEIASLAAQLRGVRGLVLDGCVRDVDAIARMNFPVFCRGTSIRGTSKRERGELNQPIEIGGVTVKAGDIVVGDSDGVVVIPADEVEPVVARAHEIRLWEQEVMQKLRAGATTLDLLGLRPVLRELGLDR